MKYMKSIRMLLTQRTAFTKPDVLKNGYFRELREDEILRPWIQCRNRPYLAGSHSKNMPKFLSRDINQYFIGIALDCSPQQKDLSTIGRNLIEYVDEEISRYSAFLVKGLPVNNALELSELISCMGLKSVVYDAGNASRQTIEENIYNASDEPKEVSIEPHNEMCYLETFPSKISFFCTASSPEGGDNAIVFNRDCIKDLRTDTLDKIKKRKIRYIRNNKHEKNSGYMTWQETFKTKDAEKVEEILTRENMGWEWRESGDLSSWFIREPCTTHLTTGEEIWFNQITANHYSYYKEMKDNVWKDLPPLDYPLHTQYGDGGEIEDDVIDEIRVALWGNAMSLKLQKGDLLILDNLLAMHSRTSYEGGEREILVNLSF